MTVRESSFNGVGGVQIFWRVWLPDAAEGVPHTVIVLVHGAGEHSGRYDHVVAALTGAGHAVYALDHRGHGRSDGPRALIDRADNAVQDLDTLVSIAREAHPGVQVFVLGHSMGGMLALAWAARHGSRADGLILSGALAAVPELPAALTVTGRVLSVLAPRAPVIGIGTDLISRDPAVVEAYRADPLVHHGRLPARTAAEIANTVAGLPDAVSAITLPILIMYGTEDGLCPPAG
ncbi:MAG: alpha/beta hydrolase, partial [Solirubrobacteraceae bacterium]